MSIMFNFTKLTKTLFYEINIIYLPQKIGFILLQNYSLPAALHINLQNLKKPKKDLTK
jgi:hypothetical protein